MKRYQLDYQSAVVVSQQNQQMIEQAQQSFLDAYTESYGTGYSFINAPFDTHYRERIISLAQEKKCLAIKMLIVIGIGGSNLGTKAVHEFLHGVYYNDMHPDVYCYFVDTIDSDAVNIIKQRMQNMLAQGDDVLINVISKSGTTTETIINFNVFLAVLKCYRPGNYRSYVVITSDTESILSEVAVQEQFSLLEIPRVIGGRFSVFTAVGLFPLCMLGIDIVALCAGAQEAVIDALSVIDNDAVRGACISYQHSMQGKNIHDMFVFGSELESFGLWYRQLVGESLGKDTHRGITPTISVGSTDLHSVGQLYLGGPYDKYVTFVSVVQNNDCLFDVQSELLHCMPQFKKNSMEFVMNAIIQGTQKAYVLDNRPFESLQIFQKNAECIGKILQWYMMRVVYMAFLLRVNPFDQPHVELYKNETRKIVKYMNN